MNTSYEDIRNTATSDEKETASLAEGENTQTSQRNVLTHNEGIDNTNVIGSSHSDETGINESHNQGRTNESNVSEDNVTVDNASTSTLTKSGKETTSHTVPGSTTLVKHSDTPLGSVDNVTGDNSNYLSDVQETKVTKGAAGDDELSFTNRKDVTELESDQTTKGSSTSDASGTSASDSQATDEKSREDYHSESSNDTTQSDSTTDDNTTLIGSHKESGSGSEKASGTSDYFGRLFGKTGSETYSEMLNKFRETFLNIDMDVINELEPLFMLLW